MDTPLATKLLQTLRGRGPTGAAAIQAELAVSQPTLSRVLSRLGPAVAVHGRARATRYAAVREVPGVPNPVSVYAQHADGQLSRRTTLVAVAPRGWLAAAGPAAGWYDDLPWFLQDLRPAGFLGRLAPRQAPALGLPPDVREWSGDDILRWAVAVGADLPGNVLVGDDALNRALSAPTAPRVARGERTERYLDLAARVLEGEPAGSWAGGEQPKFLATRVDRGVDGSEYDTPVLVKFSPPVGESVGARVADLLVAEHLALVAVHDAGHPAATSRLIRAGGRMFLEVDRFDRLGRLGRRGVVSLAAVGAHFTGEIDGWTTACARLAHQGVISEADARRARWLDRFGALIGNTDRHAWNLSFYAEEGRVSRLAPAYDMLPMRWYPRGGECPEGALALPSLDGDDPAGWQTAGAAALRFWRTVAAHPMVSSAFSSIAVEAAQRVVVFCETAARLVP
ncbi:transcriptional regulator [Deltaproteobacteria bacterium]|nr:transcriptional regulator [Deltaproteobacteria bacterium]